MGRRVVITGIGIYSCIGKNIKEVTKSLMDGRSGIGYDPERKEMGYRSALTGILDIPNLKGDLSRRQRVSLAEEAIYAYVSTKEALDSAKIDDNFLDNNIIGMIFGNDSSAKAVMESIDKIRIKKDTTLLGSGSIFQSMNSTVTMNLSTIFRIKGINFTISAACSSGGHSIGTAYNLIKSGMQDTIICGGAQEVNPHAFGSFDGLGVFSINENEPEKASKPFDKERDGLIPSGGAATLILESLDSALERKAPILAEVIGYGFSSNGKHISAPDVDGQVRSIDMALKNAGVNPAEIDYINAHATSTPLGDECEAAAIYSIFKAFNTPVSSTKSMTGHECWMSGASEIVYSVIMMQNNFIAPNINFNKADESLSKINIIAKPFKKELNTIMSNSFGFGGTNSNLIIKKYES
jgi:3-oxoacyl-[acyl-carrier-protein] synthase-1